MDRHPMDPHIDSDRMQDVPGALVQPYQIQRAFQSLSTELERLIGEDSLSEETSRELANFLLDRIPAEITENIEDMDVLTEHIGRRIHQMFSGETNNVTPEEISTFMMEIMVELGAHHTKGIILQAAPLHEFNGQTPPEPFAKVINHGEVGKKAAISFQRIGAYGCLIISGVTSVMGGKNIAGKAREWAMDNVNIINQADILQDPQVQVAMEWAGGAAAAVGVTAFALRLFKGELAEEAYSKDIGLPRAGLNVLKRRFAGSMTAKAAAVVFLGALSWDVISNADGLVTMTAGSVDKANQIADINADIDSQQENIRQQLEGTQEQMEKEAMSYGEAIIKGEGEGGKGSSGSSGHGPMYYGKVALLTDQDAGREDLNDWLAAPKKTPAAQARWDKVGEGIWSALDESPGLGTDTYQNIGSHIAATAGPSYTSLEQHMTSIDELQDSLDATDETAINKARVESIRAEFEKIQALFGEDGTLKGDLNEVMNQYNSILKKFGDVAGAHPTAYPNYKAEELSQLELPNVQIDLGSIEIRDMEYKTTWNLVTELLNEGRVGAALFWLWLALTGALLASYGNDMLLGKKVRRVHVEDREQIAENEEEYVRAIMTGFTRTFDVLLNGPYLHLGKHEPVHPEVIEAAIREYWEEQIAEKKPANRLDEYRHINRERMTHTEEVNEQNLRLRTLQEIVTSKEHLAKIMAKLLPNLGVLGSRRAIQDLDARITNPNDSKLRRENTEIERRELSRLSARMPELNHKDTEESLQGKIRTITEIFTALAKVRESSDSETLGKRNEIVATGIINAKKLFETLADLIAKKIDNIPVEERHRSVREARELLAAYERQVSTEINSMVGGLESARDNVSNADTDGLPRMESDDTTHLVLQALASKSREIEEAARKLAERDDLAERRRSAELNAAKSRDKDRKLIRRLESFKRTLEGSMGNEPLARANELLVLLGSGNTLSGVETVPQTVSDKMSRRFFMIRSELQRIRETADIQDKTSTVERIDELINTLDSARQDLFRFLRVEGGQTPN